MSSKELPEGWNHSFLGQVLYLKNGFAFKSSEYKEEGIPVIRISDIQDGRIKIDNAKRIKNHPKYKDFKIAKADILIAMSGATTGKFGIFIDTRLAYQNQRVGNLKLYSDSLINKKFIYYLLGSLKREIEKQAYGGAQPNISGEKIESLKILLPPLPEQHHIVARLEELFSDLEDGIASLKKAQEQLKTYRQAVLKYAFEGKLTAEWRKQHQPESAEMLLEQIKTEREQQYQCKLEEWQQTCEQATAAGKKKPPKPKKPKDLPPLTEAELAELPKLPEGWCWVKLSDFLEDIKYGTSKKCTYEIRGKPVLRIPNVVDGIVDQSDLKYANFDDDEIKTYSLRENDILVIRSNGSISIVGKTALVSKREEGCLYAGYLIRLRVYSDFILSKFVNYLFHSALLRNQIEKKAKSTSGVNNINSGELGSLIVPICHVAEQHQIVQEVEARLSVCDRLEQTIADSLQKAESLRQSILKQAFEGKLTEPWRKTHPNLISGEHSAAALLERIQAEKKQLEAEKNSKQMRLL